MITLGSLFDGSGGFPLAAALNGAIPVWAAEVEPYPIAVTKSRFPSMRHLGDVSNIHGGEIPPVDIITFGSPCQDMSVAGKRAGMKHDEKGDEETTRSGLFYEAVRIIREMREATNEMYPTFAVWENVPGAFSSQKGEDFRCVLQELAKIAAQGAAIPRPTDGRWLNAGEILGDGFSIAWRVLDAQYWGVPQRRKRIYLVADFRGQCAGKILFERESLRGDPATSRKTWEEAAADAHGCADGGGGLILNDQGGSVMDISKNVAMTLRAQSHQHEPVVCYGVGRDTDRCMAFMAGQGAKTGSIAANSSVSPTIRATSSGTNQAPSVCLCQNTGRGWWNEGEVAETLRTPSGGDSTKANLVVKKTAPEVFHSLTASNAQNVESAQQPNCVAYAVGGQLNQISMAEQSNTLDCMHGRQAILTKGKPPRKYIVRRLIPLECCRLQGFPDGWGVPDKKDSMTDEEYAFWLGVRMTHAIINKKPNAERVYSKEQICKWYNGLHTDSAEYKMWGNGIALPNAYYVVGGCVDALRERNT